MKKIVILFALALLSCKSDDEESKVRPQIVTYSGTVEEESEEKSPAVTTTIDGKPATPSSSMAKVIAANTEVPETVPLDEVEPTHPIAEPVPGKPGFVFNPWTEKVVDVRGLKPGTLTRDPADSDSTHKFRIP